MNGCPRQNSAKARKAITKVEVMTFKIPARSPDLNRNENFLNIVAKDLKKQAVVNNIRKHLSNFQSESNKLYLHIQWRKLKNYRNIGQKGNNGIGCQENLYQILEKNNLC